MDEAHQRCDDTLNAWNVALTTWGAAYDVWDAARVAALKELH